MRPGAVIGSTLGSPPGRRQTARVLLVLFAFTAWNLTGPANVALGLLTLLFLIDLPRAWSGLRRDPVVWLALGASAATTLLAARAAGSFPETAAMQWHAVWLWSAPFLFLVVAWWLAGDPRLARALMLAAAAGLVIGVLRKSDWTLLDAMLGGERYDFGYVALGLAFIVSVMLLGLFLFRVEITRLKLNGRHRPVLGWALWVLGLTFCVGVLVVTQARGAALTLALVGLGALIYRAMAERRGGAPSVGLGRRVLLPALMVLMIASVVLWSSRARFAYDAASVEAASSLHDLSFQTPVGARINLYRIGLRLFAERPVLGWGPGTSGTQYLVQSPAMGFPPRDREGAAEYSHLHSAGLEILVRFGLAGALMAFTILAVMARAYRCLSDRELGDQGRLRHFLLLAGAMTLIFCAYDFRLLNTEFRFFLILYLGILYSFRVHACCFPQYSGTSLQDSPTSPPVILPTLQHHTKGNHNGTCQRL